MLGTLDMDERDEGVRVSAYFDWRDGRQQRALPLEGGSVINSSAARRNASIMSAGTSRTEA